MTFTPMDEDTVLEMLPKYHSMYGNMKEDFITQLNEHCRGIFRLWATVTETLVSLMAEKNAKRVNQKMIDTTISLVFED
ncbi:MAG: hypothetical protein IPK93_10385 [Solirubrobacterales bacterium]|nr:hypothetical protein [Solirubrobacterales bacterium]